MQDGVAHVLKPVGGALHPLHREGLGEHERLHDVLARHVEDAHEGFAGDKTVLQAGQGVEVDLGAVLVLWADSAPQVQVRDGLEVRHALVLGPADVRVDGDLRPGRKGEHQVLLDQGSGDGSERWQGALMQHRSGDRSALLGHVRRWDTTDLQHGPVLTPQRVRGTQRSLVGLQAAGSGGVVGEHGDAPQLGQFIVGGVTGAGPKLRG